LTGPLGVRRVHVLAEAAQHRTELAEDVSQTRPLLATLTPLAALGAEEHAERVRSEAERVVTGVSVLVLPPPTLVVGLIVRTR
jgi:uncharacterized protein (DUF2252 family)